MNQLDFLINSAKKIVNTGKGAVSDFFVGPDYTKGAIARNTILGLPKATVDVGVDILQGIARTVGTVGITAGNVPTQLLNTVTPKSMDKPLPFDQEISTTGSKITEALFGGKPIKTVQKQTADVKQFLSPYIGDRASSVSAVPLVLGGIALDLSGWGGGKGIKSFTKGEVPEAFFKFVAKEENPVVIKNTLKKIGLDEAKSLQLSDQLARTRTVNEAKDVLVNFENKVLKAPQVKNNPVDEAKTMLTTIEKNHPSVQVRNQAGSALYELSKVPSGSVANSMIQAFSKDLDNIVKSKINPDDQNVMSDFTDYVAGSYKPSKAEAQRLELDAARIAEKYNMKAPKTTQGLANEFGRKLEESGFKRPAPKQEVLLPRQKENPIVSLTNDTINKGMVQKAKEYWKNLPNKQGGFAKNPFVKKELSEVDKLIAEGKIRVKRKGTRDVYEYKKGNIWQTARDESSAVAQVTKPKVSQAVELPKEVVEAKIALEVKKEALANSPFANKDLRLLVDREGRVRELGDVKTGKLSQKMEDMMREAGVEDARAYSEGVENLLKQKEDIKIQTQAVKEMEKVAREKLAMEKNKSKDPVSTIISGRPKSQPSIIDTTEGEGRSIEIQAQQALAINKGADVPVDVSFPAIIEKTVTNVKEKVHTIDTFLRTPKYVMEKIGFGKEAQDLRNAMDEYWKELPKNIDKITEWSKRASKGSNVDIFRYLDGEAITLLPEDKIIAQEIQAWLQDWAKKLKLPQDKKVSHYITHIFDQELLAKEFDEDLAKIIADKIPGQVYDPFLEKRLGAKGYKQDTWAALDVYVKRGTRKVHMDPVLDKIKERTGGTLDMSNIEKSQFEYIQKYINNINLRPSGAEEGIDNFIKSMIGYKFGQRPVTSILKMFRQATFRGMLGLNPASALRNLSQGANTFAVLGSKNTALGYLKLFNKGAGAELEREGVLNAGFVQDRALSAGKKAIENFDKTLFYMFSTAEKINRGSAYFGAKTEAMAQGKTEAEAIKYAKEIVRKTQFSFDVVDTPVGMSSDIMKTLFQFQTFTTKQIEFLGGMAKRAATGDEKAKNFMGLLRYAFAGLLFTYTIGKAFGMEPKEILPWYRFQTPASLKFPVELTKAALDTPDKFGNDRTAGEKVKDVAESTIGLIPAGSQTKKSYQGTKAVMEGGSYTADGKLQFEQAPGLGAKIQAILFGKYAQQNAKEYFDRVEINAKEKAKVQPIYDEVQKLKAEGKEAEALSMVNDLSDEDYAIYKKIKTTEKAKATLEGKKKVLPIYNEAQKLKNEGNEAGAKALVDALSDQEYEYYKAVKKDKEASTKAADGVKPEFGEVQTDDGIIKTTLTYAKALGVDPVTAFNRILTGQRIRYVTNGVVVVERLPLKESQAIKEERGGLTPDMKLDHTIPLQLGGSNDESNLKLVPTDEWNTYTPVENTIGLAVRNKKISKNEAQKLIVDFKDGKITSEDVFNRLK